MMSDRPWRPEQAVTIADAIEGLLDELEHRFEEEGVELPPDPLPLGTGLIALDKVLGGGLHLGTLTLVDAALPAQGRALLCAVAKRMDMPILVAASSILEATSWLLASSAQVPAALIRNGQLSADDWQLINQALPTVARRSLSLTEAATLKALDHVVGMGQHPVVLVEDVHRFGSSTEVVAALGHLAATTGAAILATATDLDLLQDWAADEATQIAMVPHGLGSRAALIGLDGLDGLTVAQIEVACLVGDIV